MDTAIALSTTQWAVLIVALVVLGGLVIGFYTRTGSGIAVHPHGAREDGSEQAPGASGGEDVSGRDPREVPDPEHGAR